MKVIVKWNIAQAAAMDALILQYSVINAEYGLLANPRRCPKQNTFTADTYADGDDDTGNYYRRFGYAVFFSAHGIDRNNSCGFEL